MNVAFCTTCKGRTSHLEQTLPENLRANPSAKQVLLDYNSRDHLQQFVWEQHSREIENGQLVIYRFTEPTPFRMAHAKNLAHRLAIMEGADVLLNLDADNFAGDGFAPFAAEALRDEPNSFLWSKMLKSQAMPRGISGRIAVSRDAFFATGGYDEVFETYSPDDKDFNCRLRMLGYKPQEIPPRFLDAIPHNDKVRFKEYPHLMDEIDWEKFESHAPSRPVANGGRYGEGIVYRNRERYPVELRALPSRIFGIGFHKTGTTSLHEALTILGYQSAHWKSAHWAKAIFTEMMELGFSPTVEKSYAISDFPIALFYKDLDAAYPGSKFILTIRNEDEWLESVKNHWTSLNPYRTQWDSDYFSHKLHAEVYGRKTFDEQVFRTRYRRHNQEVAEYFKGRRHDLLIMNMSDGASWHELCGFLGRSLPAVDYPRSFVTQH